MKKISFADNYFDLWICMNWVMDTIHKARERELTQYNISGRQSAALNAIEAIEAVGEKATPTEISRWLYRELSTVSELLSRMEAVGLVKKKSIGSGRKAEVIVSMTEKGRIATKSVIKRQSIKNALSCLSDEEYELFKSLLYKIWKKSVDEFKLHQYVSYSPFID